MEFLGSFIVAKNAAIGFFTTMGLGRFFKPKDSPAGLAESQLTESFHDKIVKKEHKIINLEQQATTYKKDNKRLQAQVKKLKAKLKLDGDKIGVKKLTEALTAFQKNDFDNADKLFKEIEEAQKLAIQVSASTALARGQIAERQVRWTEAAKHYARAAQLFPNFDTLTRAQKLAYEIGDYDSALSLAIKAKKIVIVDHGEESEQHATILGNLGGIYYEQGHYNKAESFYREALEICRKNFKENHQATAISLNNLAGINLSQKKYTEAETLYKRALSICKNIFNENHPYTAITINNLAEVCKRLGKSQKAESLYKESLQIHKKIFGENHPHTATSLSNLGSFYNVQKNYEEAEKLLKQSLEIRRITLGNNHPDTGTSLNNIGGLYLAQAQYKKAEPFCEEALKIFVTNLGHDHPDTKLIKENHEEIKKKLITNN